MKAKFFWALAIMVAVPTTTVADPPVENERASVHIYVDQSDDSSMHSGAVNNLHSLDAQAVDSAPVLDMRRRCVHCAVSNAKMHRHGASGASRQHRPKAPRTDGNNVSGNTNRNTSGDGG